MSVNYYDLLNVEPTASADEIRTAWRSAVAELDPTDRRFRALSAAAETLLDPDRRAAYDDKLAAEERTVDEAAEERAAAEHADANPDLTPDSPSTDEREPGWSPPPWLLATVGALALALVASAIWLGLRPSAQEVEDSARQAQAAAEKAVGPILDYDARDLDTSQTRAHEYLTPRYREKYDQLFDGVVKNNAPELGTRVSTEVLASGIARTGEDRADIVLFLDQRTTSKAKPEGTVFHNQVVLTMARQGDAWLVSAMCTQDC